MVDAAGTTDRWTYGWGVPTWPVGGVLLIIGVLWGAAPATAQIGDAFPSLTGHVTVGATGGSGVRTPFWLVMNRQGRRSPSGENAWVRGRVDGTFLSEGPVDLSGAADVLARGTVPATVYAHELYGRMEVGPFRVTVGRATHQQGIVDSTLSMGSTTWSRNTSPIPALRLDMPRYLDVPGTNGFVGVKGTFAHGWFEGDRFTERPYFHEKQGYIRILPQDGPVQLHAGLIHNVMWGGTHPTIGDLPDDLKAFWRVASGTRIDDEMADELPEGEDSGLGNTVAAYDAAVTAQALGWKGAVYREFYVETAASRYLRNAWDGLWGVNLVRRSGTGIVNRILYEHLRLVRHNAIWGADGRRGQRGREVYYNNFLYRNGWSYEGQVLGSPMALTDQYAPRLVSPDRDSDRPIINNIVVANHLGVAGHVTAGWDYKALLTYSRNHGAVFNPLSRHDQVTMLVEGEGPLFSERDLSLRVGLAADFGAAFEDRIGGLLALRWQPR